MFWVIENTQTLTDLFGSIEIPGYVLYPLLYIGRENRTLNDFWALKSAENTLLPLLGEETLRCKTAGTEGSPTVRFKLYCGSTPTRVN